VLKICADRDSAVVAHSAQTAHARFPFGLAHALTIRFIDALLFLHDFPVAFSVSSTSPRGARQNYANASATAASVSMRYCSSSFRGERVDGGGVRTEFSRVRGVPRVGEGGGLW
jgi:hypothetical protein